MKKSPKIRYVLIVLLLGVLTLLGVLIVPLIYWSRGFIRKYKRLWFFNFLWFFLNDTTTGKDAGDYGRFSKNWLGYVRQCAFRNPIWNFKLTLVPLKGIKHHVKGELYAYNVNKPYKFGVNSATYMIKDTKYFRFSFTKSVLWKLIISGQFGALDNRYVIKLKYRLK